MKKIFLLALTGILLSGSVALAKGRQQCCKKCPTQHCTKTCPACPKGTCKKS